MSRLVPLALLHPSGAPERIVVLGRGCPAGLVPPEAAGAGGAADLVVVAPSAAELRAPGWLARAARAAAGALAPDGLAHVIVPPPLRGRAARELGRAGLAPGAPVVHLPRPGRARYLVPLRRAAWAYAFGRLISERPRARTALLAAGRLPPRVLTEILPGIGLTAGRAGAPRASWIERLEGAALPADLCIVGTSWRGAEGAVVVHCFAPGGQEPWGVVKLVAGESAEAALLSTLRAPAAAAGARVPRVLATGRVAGRAAIAETLVRGRPAAPLLARSPGRLAGLVGALGSWLDRWQRTTAARDGAPAPADAILGPAAELRPLLPAGDEYLARLRAACAGWDPPRVAAHNDLTMWNVVVADDALPGVLDWGEAEPRGLPLTDFFYAATDAALAAAGGEGRLRALQTCFAPGGAHEPAIRPQRERLAAALGLSREDVALCFHACWLRHARGELRAGVEDGPFLEAVRWLARETAEGRPVIA